MDWFLRTDVLRKNGVEHGYSWSLVTLLFLLAYLVVSECTFYKRTIFDRFCLCLFVPEKRENAICRFTLSCIFPFNFSTSLVEISSVKKKASWKDPEISNESLLDLCHDVTYFILVWLILHIVYFIIYCNCT